MYVSRRDTVNIRYFLVNPLVRFEPRNIVKKPRKLLQTIDSFGFYPDNNRWWHVSLLLTFYLDFFCRYWLRPIAKRHSLSPTKAGFMTPAARRWVSPSLLKFRFTTKPATACFTR